MKKKKAVVLLSGGLDSTTALYWAKDRGWDIHPMVFFYGQRHSLEIASAIKIAAVAGGYILMMTDASAVGLWAQSALTKKNIDVPTNPEEAIPITYVPGRNLVFLSFAASYAEAIDADYIVTGFNQIDYSGYPDCRDEFITAFELALLVGTKRGIEGKPIKILTPLIDRTKFDIIRLGRQLDVPYELTWSCYNPQELLLGDPAVGASTQYAICGKCDSCRFRADAFALFNEPDPAVGKVFTK